MKASVRRAEFDVEGHRFEVILDVGGQWNGMAHVVDQEKLEERPDPDGVRRPQVVITGAIWDGRTLTVTPLDVCRDDYERTVGPATATLRRLTQS